LGLSALDMTAPPGQRPDSSLSMERTPRKIAADQLNGDTGSTGLGFYTQDHSAPDLVKKAIPHLEESLSSPTGRG
jgi:hypothetical protein